MIFRMRSQYIEYLNGFLDKETADEIIIAAGRTLPYWEELGLATQNNEFLRTVREAADKE